LTADPGGTAAPGVPRVKVCGVTRAGDAMLAADLGAAAIGFVFWPGSPRYLAPDAAAAIARSLPPLVAAVGVFVNQPAEEVLDIARTVPLTAVQFHGDERDDDVARFPWRAMRAVALEAAGAVERLARLPDHVTVLLDAHDPVRRGGTGRAVDWTAAASIARERRIILAGGLRAETVRDAIHVVRPWGLDVSSGVEAAPGVKDADRLRAFFAAVAMAGSG
jgi:phosphoribosylanthranilate isomerase